MKIVCVVPPVHFLVNEIGHGYLPPLGLLRVAGPLLDAGFNVELLDADAGHLSYQHIIARLRDLGADIVLVGHSGSMPANPVALELIASIRAAVPRLIIVYGGVYPTYACRELMHSQPAVDFIVYGEGEVTTRELLISLRDGKRDLGMVEGLTWRSKDDVVINSPRQPIQCLDKFRTAWELVKWSLYPNNHIGGRSAVVGFSRGCPHTCTYCGQWAFWKRWRHRSIEGFVDELQYLQEQHDVRMVWIADENWGCDQQIFFALLESIAARNVGIQIVCTMCAEHIVRDADRIELYYRAGIICVGMGVESLDDVVLKRISKNNGYEITSQAVRLLRDHNILSIVNIMYGLQDESWGSVWKTLRQLQGISPDFYNALHMTPLSWTTEGRAIDPRRVVQLNQRKWDFRQPVIQPAHFSPRMLMMAVKLSELLFYLRPSWFFNGLLDGDRIKRQIVRDAFPRMIRVHLLEWWDLLRTSFADPGQALEHPDTLTLLMPGMVLKASTAVLAPSLPES
ncbi:MAG: radical SAM protein [Desulfomonilaceae bacterium]